MQRARCARQRATPWREVHHPTRKNRHTREVQRIEAQPPVQRQHGGDRDHVCRRPIAIERNERREQRSTDDDSHRVAVDHAQNRADQRVEQAGIDHQAEVQDGEHQHDAGRCQRAQAGEHHRAELRSTEAAEQGEHYRHADQRDQRRHPPRHDQRHERGDHAEAEPCQHVVQAFSITGSTTREARSLSTNTRFVATRISPPAPSAAPVFKFRSKCGKLLDDTSSRMR